MRFNILSRGVLDLEEVLHGAGVLVVQDVEFWRVSLGFQLIVDAGGGFGHAAVFS